MPAYAAGPFHNRYVDLAPSSNRAGSESQSGKTAVHLLQRDYGRAAVVLPDPPDCYPQRLARPVRSQLGAIGRPWSRAHEHSWGKTLRTEQPAPAVVCHHVGLSPPPV